MDDKRTKIGPTGPVRAVQPSRPQPAADPLVGQTLADRYRIEKKLGAGGMGAVYLATHNVLEKQVALKVLHDELGRKPDLVERFMQEAKAASRIRHENVIDISDFGITPEGLVFFAMELLTGRDLHEEIARARLAGERLPWARSKRIFLQICGALSAAHRHGIIHRDLKPENVYLIEFLGEPDFVKLLDFGIAKLTEVESEDRKLTRTGMLFGTPEYMSPEQARGDRIDHRVDIYAMGCILFQLVTGRVPFEAENFMGVLHQHLMEPPPAIPAEDFDRIGAPRELAGVIEQALAKDRAQRFQTIDELGNAVRAVCGEAPVLPGGSGPIAAQRAPGGSGAMQHAPGGFSTTGATVQATAPPPSFAPTPSPPPGATPALFSPTPTPVPTPTGPPSGRIRTQWTGNLSVPAADEPPPRRQRSRLPLVVGALALAVGAAAVTVIVARGGDPSSSTGGGSPPGTEAAGQVGGSASGAPEAAGSPAPAAAGSGGAAAAAPPPPPPRSDDAPLPEKVTVTLSSQPRGAIVKDLVSGVVFGPTPKTFQVTPGRKPRQYLLTRKGYADAQIELVPDRAEIVHAETLVKLAPAATSGRPGSGTHGRPPPGTGDPQLKRPPDDDCPELPCLKSDPTRKGSGAGGGSGGP